MRPPESYVRVPKCARCGSQKYRRDRYRETVERRVRPCRCTGGYYPFPHRKGSKWCEHNPNWTAEDAEEEFG